MASQIVVLAFDGERTAEDKMEIFESMEEREVLQLSDLVIVSRGSNSRDVEIKQTRSRRGRTAVKYAGAGLLGGLLIGGPIGVAAIGAVLGALKDHGLDDKFIRELGDTLKPDSSAIFLLVDHADGDQVREELRPMKAHVVHTTLEPEREKALRDALAEEE